MGGIQNDIVNKLKQLSDSADWHVVFFTHGSIGIGTRTNYSRSKIAAKELSGLIKAKSISKQLKPIRSTMSFSDDELQKANVSLRNDIYSQAKNEIDTLNKTYPDQKYYLYNIDFVSSVSPMPMANEMMMAKSSGGRGAVTPVPIGNKANLQATVVIASFPEVALQKLKP